MSIRQWLPLVGLTCATFIFNTSEFMPIGLLTDIAASLGVSEPRAGLIISVYAWCVCLLSLPLMLLTARVDLRRLLLWVMALFTVGQALSAVASGYWMLMGARVIVACAHSIFWSIVSPLAVRMVGDRHKALALSMIVTGSSIAMIFGLPLGRVIGLAVGWRMTFLCVGLFSLAVVIYLASLLPRTPFHGSFSIKDLPDMLQSRVLRGIYVITLAFATAYFTGYSFIEPFLKQVSAFPEQRITFTLMLFGAMGLVGSAAFSMWYRKHPRAFLTLALSGVTMALFLLHPLSPYPVLTIAACAGWGIAVTAFNVAMQDEIIANSHPDANAVAMSIFSGIFNLGIGSGTFIGGAVCDNWSISYIGYVGAGIGLVAIIIWQTILYPALKAARKK